jgi:imidazoleglycerol phosphate synthase glutamine amidotransferase subunit HisH
MMVREDMPIWGVQFHPEHDRAGYAGARLLERWLDLL